MPVREDPLSTLTGSGKQRGWMSRAVFVKLSAYYAAFLIIDSLLYLLYYLELVTPLSDPWAYNASMGFLGGFFFGVFILYANKRYMNGITRFEYALSKCRSYHRAVHNSMVARLLREQVKDLPSSSSSSSFSEEKEEEKRKAELLGRLNGSDVSDLETLAAAAPLVLMHILDSDSLHAKKSGELTRMRKMHGTPEDTVLRRVTRIGKNVLQLELEGPPRPLFIHRLSDWLSALDGVALVLTRGEEDIESETYPVLRQEIEDAMTEVHSMDSTEIPEVIEFVLLFLNFFFLVSTSMTTYIQLSWWGLFLQAIIIVIYQTALFVALNLRDPLSNRSTGLHRRAHILERAVDHIKENANVRASASANAHYTSERWFASREEECLSVALAFSLLALLLFATGVNIATLVAHFWQRAELAAPGGDPPPPRGAGRGHRRDRKSVV